MVYIYKKTIGTKTYYYLRASEVKGNKIIVKDVAYLGSSIEEVKNSINNLPKYKEKIKKAYKKIHNVIESNYYLKKVEDLKLKKDDFLEDNLNEIEACKIHFNAIFEKQDNLTKNEILKNFIVEFAFNTTSIEGNTIKLEEARSLLEEGFTPKNKTLREIYDLQNTEKVFFDLLNKKEDLTHDFIINVHENLLKNIDPRISYRTSDVRVKLANFKATPFPYVKTDMDLLLKFYEQNKNKLHPFVLASIFHHKFEKIHPFMDGNGRTGRMLLNYILIRNNYPPLIISKKKRDLYLDALKEADKSELLEASKEKYRRLLVFNANEMSKNYWNIFL